MDIVRLAIRKPVGVTVAVLLVVMFGLIGLGAIPIQLAPNVDRPVISVTTSWSGRSPQEIVDQITKEQEERLKNVENLKSMRSTSREGQSQITLEFYIDANIDRALQDVSDSLRQVPEYPEDVDEPVITATEGESENAIAWIIIDFPPEKRAEFGDFDIATLYDALDKEVKPFLERVDGVAEINIFGGREREVRVLIDPTRLAQRGLSYNEVAAAVRSENRNTSAGTIAEGKRDYRVRVVGQFDSAEDILDTIVAYRDGSPVYVRDIGSVDMGHRKRRGFVRSLGGQAIAINAKRKTGSNVMSVMDGLQERLEVVRREILPTLDPVAGPHLRMRQVYDETTYIESAIDLVLQNLWVGGILAGLVLWIFLRSLISTGVIALAIPTSIIGTFLVMLALGRSLNVVSLAGMAFAVGMVVDNAIVVLENIYRRLQLGEPPMTAAYRGGREVWGAILASTLTTIAVFIPALTIQEEAGQLFRDISLAIVAAVALSLVVSITVIPAACSRWLRSPKDRHRPWTVLERLWRSAFGLAPLAAGLNRRIKAAMLWMMTGWRGWTLRPAVIVVMTVGSLAGAYFLMPPLDYLPAGNRNLVFGGLLIPPGYSIDQQEQVAGRIERYVAPYMTVDPSDEEAVASLDPIFRREAPQDPFDPVPIDNMFVGAFGGGMFVGASSAYEEVVLPIGTLITNAMNEVPGAFGGARQSSIFGRGVGGGNSINIEISGQRLDRVRAAAEMTFDLAAAKYGFGDVRPTPSNYNLAQPEYQVRVTREGRELGVRPADIGLAVRSLFDGAFVGDFREADGETIDIVLLPENGRLASFQEMASIPVATPAGPVVPLDTVVEVVPATAPQEILRIEELPSVQIGITPPEGAALEQTMAEIEEEILGAVYAAGMIDDTMRVRLEGTAADLTTVKHALFGAPTQGPQEPWQIAVEILSGVVALAGALVGFFVLMRAIRRRERAFAYGAMGALLMGVALGGLFFGLAAWPTLLTARLVWALAVTYLLMCALFESFIYPFVIMFSVPLAVVGGFLGLRIVHDWTMMDPTRAPQQLDVLTMLGFVILIGVVVNNAILLVHQSLNFMFGRFAEGEAADGVEGGHGMPPLEAVAEAVRTRIRPIFMSTMTSVGGMAPLVLFPGPGSEMYRGLGSVVIGGLLVSTIFTLVLVPLLFSLTLQMTEGLRAALKNEPPSENGHGDAPPPPKPEVPSSREESEELEPALAMRTVTG